MFELVGGGRVKRRLLLYVWFESVSRYPQKMNEGIVDGKSMPEDRPANSR
jgi:hypothetical protein